MLTKSNTVTVGVVVGLSAVLVFAMAAWLGPEAPATPKVTGDNTEQLPGPLTAEELQAYQVDMTNKDNPIATFVTNRGTFELELFEDTMPITAGNFIKLAEEKFYDGVKFHRVMDGFMIQSGDPLSKTEDYIKYGTGGPGYTIPDEHIPGEYLSNVRGTISMANRGPESGGSQFFINLVDNVNLDFDKPPFTSKHPVFGRVLRGMDVVDAIGKTETNANDMPLDPVIVETVTITRP
jgi:peptidylprolyl isomerase